MYDYISVLAGGRCDFGCDFCIGNSIRKNITPHFSRKLNSFLDCYADITNLLSVSGDTSDPSFIDESDHIPTYAKRINPNIKVNVHTKNTDLEPLKRFRRVGYDKIVISIDEDFIENLDSSTIKFLQETNIRFSIVLTCYNFGYFCGEDNIIDEIIKLFPNATITLRPNVLDDIHFVGSFKDILGTWVDNNNGSQYLEENPKIWFWNYNHTNPNINAMYLFSDGKISNNCRWEKLKDTK
jgi:hypothetical protein